MRLKVNPVKFGDCFVLASDKDELLLLDCGSDNRGPGNTTCRDFAFSVIASEVSSGLMKDILISHFDKDHFCGILEIPDDSVNRIYLPQTILEQKELIAGSMSRLLTIASPYSYGVKFSRLAVELFNKLPKLAKDIIFVKQGDRVDIVDAKVRIHWPKVNMSVMDQQMGAILGLGEGGGRLADGIENMALTYERRASRIIGNSQSASIGENFALLSNEFDSLCMAVSDAPNPSLLELKTRQTALATAIGICIGSMQGNVDGPARYHESLGGLLENSKEMGNTLHRLIPAKTPLRKRINAYARAEYHTLIRSMNAISIVCSFNEKALFLGDVPANIIEYLVDSGELGNEYEIVKIQHHATAAYYTDKTPSARFGVISNGGYKRRKVSERFVTSRKYDNIVCTVDAFAQCSDYCEYFSRNGSRHPSCNSVKQINNLPF